MMIDGRPVIASGSLVITAGTQATLGLPMGDFALVFNTNGPADVKLTTQPMQIRFDGMDSPLVPPQGFRSL
ncbi:hypothetical protein [Paracoccus benzoatiresistens]|uniref:Uncharacterized protein n=1 Tax=Paracoccus benzoatiresistens TaxID=2997341 RepID=A0ABT4JBV0_9RHOB|nr:hypothetical protein [Paracoccus sp. EF6]MCZ0964605.1 hypothetical protein [Paracoccus sp. EF6]